MGAAMAIVTELELPGLGPDGPAELGGVEGIYGAGHFRCAGPLVSPPGTPLAGRFHGPLPAPGATPTRINDP
jgi:hypothetical protein